ncbi:MAG: Rossmann-like and DUF2520 domain-containing protein [Salibacteraceae bacterium]
MKTISIIGSGNVATHLALALKKAGHSIHEIVSRNIINAQILADKVDAKAIDTVAKLDVHSTDMLIVSVNDDHINEVVKSIPKTNCLVVHTSGTKGIDVLDAVENQGVFYPLQTFSKLKEVSFENIPICIESNSKNGLKIIKNVASSISNDVRNTDSETRAAIHIAAVVACNFSNHLLALSEGLLKESGEDLSILKPLMEETISKAFTASPKTMQTGPAVRGDKEVIKNHLERLNSNPDLQKIYSELSNSIIKLKNE